MKIVSYMHSCAETGVTVFGVGHSPVHGVLQIPDMILFDYIQHQVLEGEYTR